MPTPTTLPSRRAQRRDKLARWLITLGGVTVIASVVAILALIVGVTVPLFRAPRAEVVCTSRLPNTLPGEDVLALGIDMGMSEADVTAFLWTTGGAVAFVDVRTGKLLGQERPTPPAGVGKRSLRQVDSLGWRQIFVALVRRRDVLGRDCRRCAEKGRRCSFSRRRHGGTRTWLHSSHLGQHSRRQGPGAANWPCSAVPTRERLPELRSSATENFPSSASSPRRTCWARRKPARITRSCRRISPPRSAR